MLTAARCITNMQEALPRAIPLLAESIPLLLQKLKRIEVCNLYAPQHYKLCYCYIV
jgi:hypothetical protein